ncbi:XdhC family protein [bacterium BD-1]|uniref:XdhC family protein n=1 Tax=Arenimonas sp. TaxID=1872635 RepID=UPI001E41E9C0|nr:XdhC family protein [Ottowia caeni]
MSAPGGLRGALAAAQAHRAAGTPFALALVTDTEGSTYRKAGALALVAADGTRTGTISGGCLEPALEALCQDAIARGQPGVAVFDTRDDDDLLFGSGSGCRGRMRVLAWPLPGPGDALFDALLAAHATGGALSLAVGVEAATLGALRFDGTAPEGFLPLRIAPVRRLLLLGAGPEAPPLLRLAHTLGWETTVADHREGLLRAARLPEAHALLALKPAATLEASPRAPDAALVMTHLASADLEALRALSTLAVPYVGLLGPPGRRDELLAELDGTQRAALLPRLHAPAGLFLGGEGPEAIALAIAADLQRHFHAPP